MGESHQVGISNTEVQTAYKCELAWLYGFHPELNYQLIKMGPARLRGIIGHKALETYYKHIQAGVGHQMAKMLALAEVQALRVEELRAGDFVDVEKLEMLNLIYKRLERFFDYRENDIENWEILEVEAFHAMKWDNEDDFYLPIRLDLTVYHKSGKFKGETTPVDHKWVYNFYKPYEVRMSSQFPLQQKALHSAKFEGKKKPVVQRTIVNMIRTRDDMKNPSDEDLFQHLDQTYSTERIEHVFKNHMKSAVRLAWIKRLPLAEAREEVQASLGSQACKFCDFRTVCDIEFDGGDPRRTIEATLKPNEYGYPPLEEIRDERSV